MLSTLSRTTIDILFLKRGPQDLPSVQTLVVGSMLAYFSLNFVLLKTGLPAVQALTHAFLSCLVLALYSHGLLRWKKRPERFTQTLLALLLSSVVLGLLTVAPMQALQPFLEEIAKAEAGAELSMQPPTWAVLLYAVVGIWHLVVMGHILRHALDSSMANGILFTLLYEILLLMTIRVANGLMGVGA
ncbi:MAG: hypothetical protein ACPHER_05870 [Nevskiales bacterium]